MLPSCKLVIHPIVVPSSGLLDLAMGKTILVDVRLLPYWHRPAGNLTGPTNLVLCGQTLCEVRPVWQRTVTSEEVDQWGVPRWINTTVTVPAPDGLVYLVPLVTEGGA